VGRIADEIVDGVAAAVGLDTNSIAAELDGFEQQVFRATRTGFSTNPAVHTFASTVHRCRISEEHIRAFFTSMRRDLDPTAYDQAALDDLKAAAEAGRTALAVLDSERRDKIVDDAVRDGRIAPAARASWRAMADKDEEGTKTLLSSLTPNTVPVAEVGVGAGNETTTEDDRLYAAAWGSKEN
jgi:hypothetical protein